MTLFLVYLVLCIPEYVVANGMSGFGSAFGSAAATANKQARTN